MKTYKEIEARRKEIYREQWNEGADIKALEAEMAELEKEEEMLFDAECENGKENGIAFAENDEATAYVTSMYECGWALYTKVNGKWDFDTISSVVEALKAFANFAREHKIRTANVLPSYLDMDYLKKIDADYWKSLRDDEYADACMASAYGDELPMMNYNRKYGIEEDYSPSNPWDAPGMTVCDFIKGVM